MSAQPFMTAGPLSIRGANAMRKPRRFYEPVPFPWSLPDRDSKPVQAFGSIVAPATATLTTVVQYQVPDGFQFVLTDRVNDYNGAGFSTGSGGPGSGDILWSTTVDNPATSTPQGYSVEFMSNETFPVGSFTIPWPVRGYLVFDPNHIIRVNVLTTAAITPGAPNYFTSILMGWIYPLR